MAKTGATTMDKTIYFTQVCIFEQCHKTVQNHLICNMCHYDKVTGGSHRR